MKATLRQIYSLDVDDLRSWSPEPGNGAVLLRLIIGPSGAQGEESFDVTVCSADWFCERVAESGLLDGRHHLVFNKYDFDEIERYFTRRVAECSGETWPELASQLSQIGAWEFTDYREFRG